MTSEGQQRAAPRHPKAAPLWFGRPRFVVVLAAAALATAAFDAARLLAAATSGAVASASSHWLGWTFAGVAAVGVHAVRGVGFAAIAVGLLRRASWSRYAAMAYLVAEVVAALLVRGPGGYGAGAAGAWILWQLSVVPFTVFCLMYLYLGERHFD